MAGENCPFGPARVRGKIFRLLTKFFPFQNRKNFARGVRSVRIAYPPCKWPPSRILIVDKFRRKWPSACTPGFRSVVLWPVSRGLRSEEHTSELQSLRHLVCRLLLEKKN